MMTRLSRARMLHEGLEFRGKLAKLYSQIFPKAKQDNLYPLNVMLSLTRALTVRIFDRATVRLCAMCGLVLMVMCVGCAKQPSVSLTFKTEVEVSEGSEVYYQQDVIGKIDRIAKEGKGTRVYLSLDSEKLEELKKGSAALIVSRDGEANVDVYNSRSSKEPLADGDELVALHNAMEYVTWQAGETVEFTQSTLFEMTASLQNFFQSEQWTQQKQEMQKDMERFGSDVEAAITKMQQDYDALITELEAQSQQSRKQAEERYKELTTTLHQQIEELLKNGEQTLADALQQFLNSLHQLMQGISELREQHKTSGATT